MVTGPHFLEAIMGDEDQPTKPMIPQGLPGRFFQKGTSENPGGKPKVLTREEEKLKFAPHTEKAKKVIVKLLDSEDEAIALAAARTVFERAWGKPVTSDANAGNGGLVINIMKFGEGDDFKIVNGRDAVSHPSKFLE
jgi:hypothetical protein